jgi:hypothetical protein
MDLGNDPGILEMLPSTVPSSSHVEDDDAHVEDEHPIHPLQGMSLGNRKNTHVLAKRFGRI